MRGGAGEGDEGRSTHSVFPKSSPRLYDIILGGGMVGTYGCSRTGDHK